MTAAEEFEDRDLGGATFWGVSLREATFRDVDFTGVRTHHVFLRDVEFDGIVDGLVVNGVDVTEFVRQHDPWQPLRGMLTPTTAAEVRAGWQETTSVWAELLDRVDRLPDDARHERVNGEWSFVETLRHLVFVVDKWIGAPLRGGTTFDPLGLSNSGSADFPWSGLDPTADPTFDEVRAARSSQLEMIDELVAHLDDGDLTRAVEVPENGRATALDCWHTLLEEHFEHRRYALRDLDRLA